MSGAPTQATAYRLFDRRIWSDVPLRLLPTATGQEPLAPGTEPADIRVRWHYTPTRVDPKSPFVLGNHRTEICCRSIESGYMFDYPSHGLRVKINKIGTELDIHPWAPTNQPTSGPTNSLDYSPELVQDSLVTAILTRLPSLWGYVAIHAAALTTPHGLVLLMGDSGVGKSTISQYLARERGWTILDDDTNVLIPEASGIRIIPMGALARLRRDASDELDLSGSLPLGPRSTKIASSAATDEQLKSAPNHVAAAFYLATFPPAQSEEPRHSTRREIAIEPVEGPQSFVSAARSSLRIDRTSRPWQLGLMRLAQTLSSSRAVAVTYSRPDTHPQDLASLIASVVESTQTVKIRTLRPR